MKLNCKPGCLAIVVKGANPNSPRTNVGKIVTCIKYVGDITDLVGFTVSSKNLWLVDKPLFFSRNNKTALVNFPYCRDDYLRMLNDPDFTEDTITGTQLTHKEKDHV